MIKRIKVHNMNAVKDPSYRFPGNYGVEKFLELFSGELIMKHINFQVFVYVFIIKGNLIFFTLYGFN